MIKEIRKVKNRTKSKSSKSKSKSRSQKSKSKLMRGGNAGRYVLPPSYFGSGTSGYYPEGSKELATSSTQHAVSQGSIWSNNQYAGPNLYPSMTGGGCGCSGRKNKYKTCSKKSRKSKQSNKSRRSNKSKKSNK